VALLPEVVLTRLKPRRQILLNFLYQQRSTIAPYRSPQQWVWQAVYPALVIPKHRKFNLLLAQSLAQLTVSVPNVVGLTQSAASSALASVGLSAGTVTFQTSLTIPVGIVISQSPIAGSNVSTGSKVNLAVSSGTGFVLLQDAIYACVNAGFVVAQPIDWQHDPTVPYGYVISQNPPALTSVPFGTPVHLVASLGPAFTVNTITVPQLIGVPMIEANRILSLLGLGTATPIWQNNNVYPATLVISHSPASGAIVQPQTPVVLTVSMGPVINWPADGNLTVPLVH
jgi:beta-lactam-binding protein with PASTA domain